MTLVRAHYPDASLNGLLLTATELVVVHVNSPHGAPIDEMLALPAGPPPDYDAAYFLMRWLRAADGSLIFASSGMDARDWTPLPEDSVTSADRHLLMTEYRSPGVVA